MNKFHILLFVIIIGIFGLIVFSTQKDAFKNSDFPVSPTPSLPPESDKLQFISQAPASNQNQQQAQQQTPPAAIQGPVNASVSATIKTSEGDISVILFGKEAPNTVANFISKAKTDYYKGLIFHRVEDWVVQGGDPRGDGTGGGQMLTELNAKPFVVGSLGIARGSDQRISNDSQFFITKTAADWLNGQYTNFGIVTSGIEVVNKMKIGDKILGITTQ